MLETGVCSDVEAVKKMSAHEAPVVSFADIEFITEYMANEGE